MLIQIQHYELVVLLVMPHTTPITQRINVCFTVRIHSQIPVDMFVWTNVIQDFIHQLIAQQINVSLNVLLLLTYTINLMFVYFTARKMDFLQIIRHGNARTDVQTSLGLMPILVMAIQPQVDVLINAPKVYGEIIILICVCQFARLNLLLKT
jgi:hypothetical protein